MVVIGDSTTIRRSAQILLAQAQCEVILAEPSLGALVKVEASPRYLPGRNDAGPGRVQTEPIEQLKSPLAGLEV